MSRLVLPDTTAGPTRAAPDDQAARLRALAGWSSASSRSDPFALNKESVGTPRRPARLPARVVAIASGKGGVGKTTLAVNLAAALSRQGHSTVLVDADLGLANADVLCGLCPRRRLDEALAPRSRVTLRELAILAPGGFRLVPGTSGVAPDVGQCRALTSAIAGLRDEGGVVIVDMGAGLASETLPLARDADLTMVIATPDPASVTDAYALIKCLAQQGESPRPVLLVNQCAGEGEAQRVHQRIATVCERFLSFRLPLIGWVPTDTRMAAAVRRRRVLMAHRARGPAARQITALCRAVVKQTCPNELQTIDPQRMFVR